ncbi:MAG: acetate uptake transporter [Marinifilaceae bacterium]
MTNKIEETANPGPLGLIGFGLATILLNLHNAGLFGLDTMVLAMGIFMGGIVQILVGMLEFKKNNMFGMIAFTSYGAFWLTLVVLILLPQLGLGTAPSPIAMGWYLTVWGLFSLGLYVATFSMNFAMKLLFATVVALFALLAIADFTGIHLIKTIAGIEGVFCGGLAVYIAMAQLFKETFGRDVLPLG